MTNEIVTKIDATVAQVFGATTIQGFERAHVVAKAILELRELLTPEYMKPIMALQGSRLGFRTDKDKTGGYSEAEVKNCLIEAVLRGLQPTGNQFNIISGNAYATKEGCGALLNRKDFFPHLKKSINVGLPRINNEKTSAAFDVVIKWSNGGDERQETISIPIKIDAYASVDSMVGKATRKARAWLLSEITGVEMGEAEVDDQGTANVMESKQKQPVKSAVEKQHERMMALIAGAKTIQELEGYKKDIDDNAEQHFAYEQKMTELKSLKK